MAKGSLSYRISQEGAQGCPGGFMDDDARVTVVTLLHTMGQKKQRS